MFLVKVNDYDHIFCNNIEMNEDAMVFQTTKGTLIYTRQRIEVITYKTQNHES